MAKTIKRKAAKQPPPKQPRKETDWTAIMVHVRAGLRTYAEIGDEFGVTKGRISQKAKELGVTRDLAPTIRAAAEAKVNAATTKDATEKKPAKQIEGEIVEAGAQLMADSIIRQRSFVKRLMGLASGLLNELELDAEAALADPPKKGAKDAESAKPAPVPQRLENLRKLGEISRTLITIERTVLNITPDTPIDPAARVKEAVDNGFAGLRAAFDKRLGKA